MKRIFLIVLTTIVVSNTFAFDFKSLYEGIQENVKQATEWVAGLYIDKNPKTQDDIVEMLDGLYNSGEKVAKSIKPVVVEKSPKIVEKLDKLFDYGSNINPYDFECKTIAGRGHSFLVQCDANTGKLIAICHDDWGCPCTGHNDAELFEFMEEYVETMRDCGMLDSRFSWDNKPLLANEMDCKVY